MDYIGWFMEMNYRLGELFMSSFIFGFYVLLKQSYLQNVIRNDNMLLLGYLEVF